MKKHILLIAIAFCGLFLQAQDVETTRFMRYAPALNHHDLTAAPVYKGYLFIPAISDLDLGVYNASLKYHNLFITDSEGYPTSASSMT